MSHTLGELVDKLSIINMKLWHAQDALHKASQTDQPLDATNTGLLMSLNLERNRLMTAIDLCLAQALESGETPVDRRPKIY